MSDELDKVLSAEELGLAKDKEIERVLNCCQWDYFSILEINPLDEDNNLQNQIKRTYRRKTLLIHPDKVSNPRAPLAFDRLKKAELVLSFNIPEDESEFQSQDERSRVLIGEKKRLLAIYEDAQKKLSSSKKISKSGTYNKEDYQQLLSKVSEILNEEIKLEEIERNFQQQQDAKRLADIKKAQQERELKKKLASQWEDERDLRVSNWRSYTSKVEKPKSKKRSKTGKLKSNILA